MVLTSLNEVKAIMLLKKDYVTSRKRSFNMVGRLISVPPASFPGGVRGAASLTYVRSRISSVTLAPLQSTILQKCLFLFFHTNSSEKCGEAMRDNTSP